MVVVAPGILMSSYYLRTIRCSCWWGKSEDGSCFFPGRLPDFFRIRLLVVPKDMLVFEGNHIMSVVG
jgi:hypothetical protein